MDTSDALQHLQQYEVLYLDTWITISVLSFNTILKII